MNDQGRKSTLACASVIAILLGGALACGFEDREATDGQDMSAHLADQPLDKLGVVSATEEDAGTQGLLTQCTPAFNCTTPDKPCYTTIGEGVTKNLVTNNQLGASVFRVRMCTSLSSVCKSASYPQTMSVFGYSGVNSVYEKHLHGGVSDTGPYTEIPSLTNLRVRCNTAYPGSACKLAWQHCKKTGSLGD
ncbi:hypothetical protein [Enhygromyxa salina]|uniref:Lipoprotein n=1 Tax=Enhygromyxa salina TaxID=215803 RepID=A0A2S9YJ79_9BACT|nr:hypothetical protein [Enhygromyxa salina]PRQ05159.1 hypothetical protein ENSA7_47880 [Enhygromyxa salina]